MTVDELSRIANRLRLDVVETVHLAGDGHPGPCMSIADIMAVLFFEEMKLDPNNPHWPERDRFILSKGHVLFDQFSERAHSQLVSPVSDRDDLRSVPLRCRQDLLGIRHHVIDHDPAHIVEMPVFPLAGPTCRRGNDPSAPKYDRDRSSPYTAFWLS